MLGLLGTTFVVGSWGMIHYAKTHDEFRKTLYSRIPWMRPWLSTSKTLPLEPSPRIDNKHSSIETASSNMTSANSQRLHDVGTGDRTPSQSNNDLVTPLSKTPSSEIGLETPMKVESDGSLEDITNTHHQKESSMMTGPFVVNIETPSQADKQQPSSFSVGDDRSFPIDNDVHHNDNRSNGESESIKSTAEHPIENNPRKETFRLMDEMERVLGKLERMMNEISNGESSKSALYAFRQQLTRIRTKLLDDTNQAFSEVALSIFEGTLGFLQMLLAFHENRKTHLGETHQQSVDIAEKSSSSEAETMTFESIKRELDQRVHELERQMREEKAELEKKSLEEIQRLEIELSRKYHNKFQMELARERHERHLRLDGITSRLNLLETYTRDLINLHGMQQKWHRILFSIKAVRESLAHPSFSSMSTIRNNDIQRHVFDEALMKLRQEVALSDSVSQKILENITEQLYDRGVWNERRLRDKFHSITGKIRQVQFVSETGGFWSHLVSSLLSHLSVRPHPATIDIRRPLLDTEINDVELILARTKMFLDAGDLYGAIHEVVYLKGWSRRIAHDWIHQVREYLEFQQALDVIDARISLMTLPMA